MSRLQAEVPLKNAGIGIDGEPAGAAGGRPGIRGTPPEAEKGRGINQTDLTVKEEVGAVSTSLAPGHLKGELRRGRLVAGSRDLEIEGMAPCRRRCPGNDASAPPSWSIREATFPGHSTQRGRLLLWR